MKNLITKEEKDRIDKICKKYKIQNYSINSDGSIDVVGNVSLSRGILTEFPLVFNNVTGDFYCSGNELTTLAGGPTTVGGSFLCGYNKLTTLFGAPEKVGRNFYCSNNKLTSLVGSPTTISGVFSCFENKLTSFDGAPRTINNWQCSNSELISTYSGDVDIDLIGYIYLKNTMLPQLIIDNMDQIKLILKYQRYFDIWNPDLSLNVENFNDLIAEINDGLESIFTLD